MITPKPMPEPSANENRTVADGSALGIKTLKAARAAGFRKPQDWQYGGEEILIKGHLLVRNTEEAISRSAWRAKGFSVLKDAVPHAQVSGHVAGGEMGATYSKTWDVFRSDQVKPFTKPTPKPPKEVPILAAVWAINRAAKRYRDVASTYYGKDMHGFAGTASDKKKELYSLKSRVLEHLVAEGQLAHAGTTCFGGGLWAEVVAGGGYTFHRPCPQPEVGLAVVCEQIEARPRETTEPKLKDAIFTAETYLAARPHRDVFSWPARKKKPREWDSGHDRFREDYNWNGDEDEDEHDGR